MSVLHGKLGGGPMVSFVASNDTASNLHLYFPKSGWELLNLKVQKDTNGCQAITEHFEVTIILCQIEFLASFKYYL